MEKIRGQRAGNVRAALLQGSTVGLGWGLGVALLDGLPLLLQGALAPHLGSRLLALAYLAVLWGVLGALVGGGLGAAMAKRSSRPQGLPETLGVWVGSGRAAVPGGQDITGWVVGWLAALTGGMAWGQRAAPGLLGWVLIAVPAAVAGLATGRLAARVARSRVVGLPAGRRAVRLAAVVLFVVALGAVLVTGLTRALPGNGGRAATAGAGSPPSIVLITAEGVRADHLGAYGYDPAISPNLDALAARGVRFEQAIAPGSWGRPSVAALLTSLYPTELGYSCGPEGLGDWPAPDSLRTTLAEALGVAGYRTGAFVASPWLNAPGLAQGFEAFEAARDQEPFDDAPMRGRMMARLLGCREGSAACRLYRQGRGLLFDARLIANQGGEALNERAARWLDRLGPGGEPFFLWVHYDDALPPYNLAAPFRPLPEDALASPEKRLKNLGYWELGNPFTAREELLPLDREGLTALYDGEVQRVDRLAGELLALLQERGPDGNTVVVFAAAHGQELFDHGGYTYGHTLYNEVTHAALIVAGPPVSSPGRVVTAAVSLLDVAPTLAEAAGTGLGGESEGQSLLPALRGETIEERPLFSEALYRVPLARYALWRGGYKLIYHDEEMSGELYDLRADPGERHDLAAELPDLAHEMVGAVQSWKTRMREQYLSLPQSPPPPITTRELW